MGRSPEAKQSGALSRFDASDAKTAEADDACTQERSGVQIVEQSGQREDEVSASENVFRISASDICSR